MAEELNLVTPFTAGEAPSMENFNRRIEEANRLAVQVSEGAMPITGGMSPGAFSVQGGTGPYSSLTVDSTVITLNPIGATSFSGKRLINVGEPVADTDAATKAYVDSAGGGGGPYYATCATAYSTTAKVAVCEGFQLATGATVIVKFTYYNTATSPTLNVNGTGAKAIKKYGTTGSMAYMWYSGEMVQFTYDGTYWVMTKGMTATTTYYGLTKLSDSLTDYSTTTAATPNTVRQAYQRADAAYVLAQNHEHGADRILISDETAQALFGQPVTFQNLVRDGDFSEVEMGSLMYWSCSSANAHWNAALNRCKSVYFHSNAGSISQTVTLTDGHMHYFRLLLSCDDAVGEASVSVEPCGVSADGVALSNTRTVPVSGLFTPRLPTGTSASTLSVMLSIDVTDGRGTPVMDEVLLVDLTEAFGAGNEPDKAWCDENIPYFEGNWEYNVHTVDEALNAILPLSGGAVFPEECLVTIRCYDSSGNILRETKAYAPPQDPGGEYAVPDYFRRRILTAFITPESTEKIVVQPPEGFAFQAFLDSFGARLFSSATNNPYMWGITTPEGYASFGPNSPGYSTGCLNAAYVALCGVVGIELA